MTVVVSGIGIVSPLGEGAMAHWARIVAGASAIAPLAADGHDSLPLAAGARVPAFDVKPYLKDKKMARLLNPASALTLAASQLALADAGLDLASIPPARRGLYCQTGMFQVEGKDLAPIVEHCCDAGSLSLARFGEKGMSVINPFLPIKTLPNMGLGAIAIAFDFQGPNLVVGPFASQGAMALELARVAIESGDADVCLVAGGDAPFNMMTVSTLLGMGVLDRRDLPHLGLFDPANDGLILGEGGVALELERADLVAARGGRAYAVPGPVWMASGEGEGPGPTTDAAALDFVLGKACEGGAPGLVVAEGSGLPAVDAAERLAIGRAAPQAPVASAKPLVGAWPGAAFLLEAAHAALAVHQGGWPAADLHPGRAVVLGLDLAGTVAAMAFERPSAGDFNAPAASASSEAP